MRTVTMMDEKLNKRIGEKVYKRRKELKISQTQLAKLMGYENRSSIARIERGDNDIRRSRLAQLAKILKVDLSYFLDDNERYPAARIPMFDGIPCGTAVYIDENPEEIITIPTSFTKPNRNYFANTAKGYSMLGVGINDGDILIFEQTDNLNVGDVGSFEVNGEYNCKKFKRPDERHVILESANPEYPNIEVDLAKDEFRIVGKLVATLSKFKSL